MAASRRKKTGAKRGSKGTPAWMWLFTGVLIGLGMAYYLWAKGYLPQPQAEKPAAGEPAQQAGTVEADEVAPAQNERKKSRYDFFTVLPEMEVVVPEQELSRKGQPPETPAVQADDSNYLLQVGSFREKADAEQLKARLALLGMVARIHTVRVNDATWHRVRVGPVTGARRADEMRRQLADNGIDSLVLKDQ
jgi:cell division protein FtsN